MKINLRRIIQTVVLTVAVTVLVVPWLAAQTSGSADALAAAEALATGSPTPENYLNLSWLYNQNGRYQDSIAACQEALKLKPDYAEAYNNIAAADQSIGKWDEAIQAAQKAMQLKPDFQLAKNNLDWSSSQRKAQADNLAAAQIQAKDFPTPENYLILSWNYDQNGRYRESIAACQQALAIQPEFAEAYNNIAAADVAMGMWDEAVLAAQKALRYKPDLDLARGNLDWALLQKKGEVDRLTAAEALATNSPTPENYLSLSWHYDKNGRYQDEIAACTEALRLRPGYADAYNNIAAANLALGRWDEAIQAAQQALSIKPDFQLARNNLQYSLDQKRLKDATSAK